MLVRDINIESTEGKFKKNVFTKHALYIPNIHANFLSISKITENGSKVVFTKEQAQIYDKYGKPILTAKRSDILYYLKEKIVTSDACINDLEI